ncbi:hypothetical protein GCM10009753_39140 [Streptantibioticus ferralitis]
MAAQQPLPDVALPLWEVREMPDRTLWSYADIAAHIRVRTDTVRSYRKHGLLPPPDVVECGKPYWYADTIRLWTSRRPGNRSRRNRDG